MNESVSQPVVSCHALTKRFVDGELDVTVLRGVDLQVMPGETIAVLGASGSGKSTLLHCLGTLEPPSSGFVKIFGQDPAALTEGQRCELRNSKLGFVYQFHHLLPEFTALENVMMPLLIRGMPKSKASVEASGWLELVGLAHRQHHKPSELSGGERQRVAISRALVNKPACVLCDEPTGNLDHLTAQSTLGLLLELSRTQKTSFILVTHDTEVAAQLDRRLVMQDGVLLSQSEELRDGT